MILVWAVVPVCGQTDPSRAVKAGMAADGRTITFSAPGLLDFQGGFSAVIISGTRTQVLSSAAGNAPASTERTAEVTPYGKAMVTAVTLRFENEEIDLLLRLGQVPGVTGLLAQAGIRNAGKSPVRLVSVTPLVLTGQVTGKPSEWLVTALDTSVRDKPVPVATLGEITNSFSVHEYGGFYRADGAGFLFGPVGTPIAYVSAVIEHGGDGRPAFRYSADMSGVQVDPGETRWGQQVALLAEPPQKALARWADWVAKTHGARTDKGALSGWSSWNALKKKDISKEILDVTDTVLNSGGRLQPGVIQIDMDANDPGGLKAIDAPWAAQCVQRIRQSGARSGLRLEFAPKMDPRGIDTQIGVSETVSRAVRNGFNYLKIFYVQTGATAAGGKRTAFEICRDDWQAIRKAAGDDVYLLYCETYPNRAVLGAVDASRIGVEAQRFGIRLAMNDVVHSYQLQGRWFAVDFDTYYLGSDIQNLSEISGGWPLVRLWISMVGLSGGTAITSDPWYWESFKPYLRNVEIMTPPANERAEVIDLCTSKDCPRLVSHVSREWADGTVVLLWNPGVKEAAVSLDFKAAGLDPERRYAVWSFWDNRYLGVAKGSWTTPALAGSASQHLRFTDLDRTPDLPVLIGSSLHIYCGVAEIRKVTASRGAMEIELTDAGAREGDLFVYSRLPVVLKTASGCKSTGVSQAGENAWRISLADRRRGAPQRVTLAVMLPVTQQSWFWLLILTVVVSLMLTAWRYIVAVRLEREKALEQERGRIARDLHDDLGANLAEIAMLSELAQDDVPAASPARAYLNDIFNRAESNVRTLGEIVWAIKPANDTLESFAGYLCKFAQDYISLAGIRCRIDLPETLPALPLDSYRRHNLFLAAKEAIHNAVKHASPSEIVLRIAADGRLVVSVEDNGCGCAETPQAVKESRGSANMRMRMEQIGGTFERRSTVGRGTVVTLTLPLDSQRRRL